MGAGTVESRQEMSTERWQVTKSCRDLFVFIRNLTVNCSEMENNSRFMRRVIEDLQ